MMIFLPKWLSYPSDFCKILTKSNLCRNDTYLSFKTNNLFGKAVPLTHFVKY